MISKLINYIIQHIPHNRHTFLIIYYILLIFILQFSWVFGGVSDYSAKGRGWSGRNQKNRICFVM